jgi:hypothetical protein
MGGFAGCTAAFENNRPFFMSIATDFTPPSTHSVDVINNNGNAPEIETIDLAEYYFSPDPFSSAFNWRTVALTLEAWDRLTKDHYGFLMPIDEPNDNPDPQVLVLNYREVDLWIIQGIRRTIVWHGRERSCALILTIRASRPRPSCQPVP